MGWAAGEARGACEVSGVPSRFTVPPLQNGERASRALEELRKPLPQEEARCCAVVIIRVRHFDF